VIDREHHRPTIGREAMPTSLVAQCSPVPLLRASIQLRGRPARDSRAAPSRRACAGPKGSQVPGKTGGTAEACEQQVHRAAIRHGPLRPALFPEQSYVGSRRSDT
jgi:hypothetical protein